MLYFTILKYSVWVEKYNGLNYNFDIVNKLILLH